MNSNQSTPASAVAALQQEIRTRTEVIRTLADLREQLDACLENIRPQCRTTSDSIRFALELEAIIRQWVESPKKKDSPENHAEPKVIFN